MLLCKTFDLDKEKLSDVLRDARETFAYLENVIKFIESKVVSGEKISNIILVPQRHRVITEVGLDYLKKILGEENVVKTITKPIGIGELEKLLTPDEVLALTGKGVIGYQLMKPKIVIVE
jgi:hypothetical protein